MISQFLILLYQLINSDELKGVIRIPIERDLQFQGLSVSPFNAYPTMRCLYSGCTEGIGRVTPLLQIHTTVTKVSYTNVY